MEEVSEQNSNEAVALQETEAAQGVIAQDKDTDESKDPHWLKNLRKDRQKLAQDNRLKDELIAKLIQQHNAPNPVVPQEEDFIESIQKEEYVPGEKVAKGFKKLKEEFKQELKEMENKYKASAYQSKISTLKQKYADLEDIVNPDTLQIVKEKDPETAQTWAGMDDYTLYLNAYPYIKHTGILDDVPGYKRTKEVDKKIAQNKKTVPSPAAFDKRPMAQAFDSSNPTPEYLKEVNREMTRFASMSGGAY